MLEISTQSYLSHSQIGVISVNSSQLTAFIWITVSEYVFQGTLSMSVGTKYGPKKADAKMKFLE